MNRRHVFSLSLVLGAAGLIVWKSMWSFPPKQAPETTSQDALGPPPIAVIEDKPSPARAQAPEEAVTSTPNSLPADVAVSENFPNLGCRLMPRPSSPHNGDVAVTACARFNRTVDNVYAKSTAEELETYALTDPQAAQMIAYRSSVSDPARALKYTLRAAALGNGDAMPLLWYMSNVRPAPRFSYKQQKNLERIKMNYVLSAVAESLGSRTELAQHAYWRDLLTRAEPQPDVMMRLDQHRTSLLEAIYQIQYEAGIAPTTAE